MPSIEALYRWTQLDRTRFPEFRERIARVEQEGVSHSARSYPGYPRYPLDPVRARPWPPLELTLQRRRSIRTLGEELPSRRAVSRLLRYAHGVFAEQDKGPTPSAGGLQSLELYLVALSPSWLEAGLYHYDRVAHQLARLAAGAERDHWRGLVPSMGQFEGGSLLLVLVGDGERVGRKYG